MPRIPNFPQELMEEHKNWHHARHNINKTNPPVGYGYDLLQYHRHFIGRALAWYQQNGLDPRLIEAWTAVPEPIRRSPCYDQAAETRILLQPKTFATADELGRFIESSEIHSCIHQEAAKLYREPDINDFDTAPHNTIFYNIHGMVDRWWRNWEGLGRFQEGQSYWCGRFDVEDNEMLYYRSDDGSWWLGKTLMRAMGSDGLQTGALEWEPVGNSNDFGRVSDGRLFRIWDVDGDGKLEVLFRHPRHGYWVEGKVKGGRIIWKPVRLQSRYF